MTIIDLKKRFVEIYGGSTEDLRVFSAAGQSKKLSATMKFTR